MLKVSLLLMVFLQIAWSMDEGDELAQDPYWAWLNLKVIIPSVKEIFEKYSQSSIETKLEDNNSDSGNRKKEEFIKAIKSFDAAISLHLNTMINDAPASFYSPSQLCISSGEHFNDVAKQVLNHPNKEVLTQHFTRLLSDFFKRVEAIE